MSNVIIKAEGLGKKYILSHQRQSYYALRDVIADGVRKMFKRGIVEPFKRLTSDSTAQQLNRSTKEDFWALKDISFEIKEGDRVGIIGRNGAGKSTLLKILSRITEPTTGQVGIHGRTASLLEVGTGFHPELTGRENVYLNGAILGMTKREIKRKFDEIVDFAEVEKFLDTPVKRYSSGMYVRLAFAVAAHLEPEILVVDEVLAVGDAQFQKKCLGKMEDVGKEGRTVLFVSHNMTAVQRLCNHALCLEHGKQVSIGEVSQVVSQYLQSGANCVLERNWTDNQSAPGNDTAKILRTSVKPLQPVSDGLLTIQTPLLFEFEIWNNVPGAALNFSIHLYSLDGNHIFAVASESMPRPRGLVKGEFQVPGNFLNDGTYTVTILVVIDGSHAILEYPNALIFEVHEAGRTGKWLGKWPGAVRPKFAFPTQNVEFIA
jgi:lipopolysaccharide transport system ATP-binding protein